MVGNTFTNLVMKVFFLDEITMFHLLTMLLGPLIFNILVAWLLFSYAKRVDLQLEFVNEEKRLYAGMKLLGFYLLAFGIPSAISVLIFSASQLELENSEALFMEATTSTALQVFIGYVLLFYTTTVPLKAQ